MPHGWNAKPRRSRNALAPRNQRGDDYVLVTILFASVLFFAGISSKMDTKRARLFLLGTGVVVFVCASVVVLSFPKEF